MLLLFAIVTLTSAKRSDRRLDELTINLGPGPRSGPRNSRKKPMHRHHSGTGGGSGWISSSTTTTSSSKSTREEEIRKSSSSSSTTTTTTTSIFAGLYTKDTYTKASSATWGGYCTCPNGKTYPVSDGNTDCVKLLCFGGLPGKCNKRSGPWSEMAVTCGKPVPQIVVLKVAELEAELSRYKKNIENFHSALSKTEKQTTMLTTELATCKAGLTAEDKKALEMQEKMDSLQTEYEESVKSLGTCNSKVAKLKSGHTAAEGTIADVTAELKETKIALNKANASVKTCVTSMNADENKLIACKEDKKSCDDNLEDAKTKIITIEKTKNVMQSELKTVRTTLVKIQNKITTITKLKVLKEKECSDSKEEVDKLTKEVGTCEAQIGKLEWKLLLAKVELRPVTKQNPWRDLGAGCPASPALYKKPLFNAFLGKGGSLQACKTKCLSFGADCGYISYGWKDSTWCNVYRNQGYGGLDDSPKACGSSGNNGVHTYELDFAMYMVYINTFKSTGCPNKKVNVNVWWWMTQKDARVWNDMYRYCTLTSEGHADQHQMDICCGAGVKCKPQMCHQPTAWVQNENKSTAVPYDGLLHAGQNCWEYCSHTSGPCHWCGTGRCCRKGWYNNPINGCPSDDAKNVAWFDEHHVCIAGRNDVENLSCPTGFTISYGKNDIPGCGLQKCGARSKYSTMKECGEACMKTNKCLSFTWAPVGGDRNWMKQNVCTMYPSRYASGNWGPHQTFCALNTKGTLAGSIIPPQNADASTVNVPISELVNDVYARDQLSQMWGGQCTCPNGKTYQVSDGGYDCTQLMCIGGSPGKCNKKAGPWSEMSVTCAPACPKGWLNYYNHRCFYFGKKKMTHAKAAAFCKSRGALLATVPDAATNAFLKKHQTPKSWISLNDRAKEGDFKWASGAPYGYKNWADKEPNNAGGKENCVHMYDSGKWNDIGCGYQYHFICETPYPTPPGTEEGVPLRQ